MQNKNNRNKSIGSHKSMTSQSLKKGAKKKKAVYSPGLYKMIFFWILAILLCFAIYLRLRHFFNTHW